MEREKIIKALEHWTKNFDGKLTDFQTLCEATLLIKKLNEENDRLSTALAEYDHKTNIRISEEYVHNEAYEELREENERLKADNEALTIEIKKLLKAAWTVEADTVKKMQERLKAVAYQSSDWSHGEHPMVVEVDDIDEITEEMLEGNDGK